MNLYRINKVGSRSPIFGYTTIHENQSAYIKNRCKEEKIAVNYFAGELQIFSKKKIPKFTEIIKESLEIYSNGKKAELKSSHASYCIGKSLICVLLKDSNTVYVTESKMEVLSDKIYRKEIPKPKNYKIFRTKKELQSKLLEDEGIIV